jgi:hypothetical protein
MPVFVNWTYAVATMAVRQKWLRHSPLQIPVITPWVKTLIAPSPFYSNLKKHQEYPPEKDHFPNINWIQCTEELN